MSYLLSQINKLAEKIINIDNILIGGGAGLSTAAGQSYSGERFDKYFSDFKEKYGIKDMYSGGFYSFPTPEEFWAWWSRQITINRYNKGENLLYKNLFDLVKEKNYFVLTTNADHLFIRNGFNKERVFYTQGNYGLWQCSKACHKVNYDNEEIIEKMYKTQKDMKIPSEYIPYCPKCNAPMTPTLRKDHFFVEDEGWHRAFLRYSAYIKQVSSSPLLLLELGVGSNTPTIIKYPFWDITKANKEAYYSCINADAKQIYEPVKERSINVCGDIAQIIEDVKKVIEE